MNNQSDAVQYGETNIEYQRKVLKYITEIGSSLRLDMDTDTLFKRVSEAICKAVGFRYSALYLSDGTGYFRARATTGAGVEEEEYLRQHPLPEAVVAQMISEEYRMSESYFIPAEASIWEDDQITSFFVLPDDVSEPSAMYMETVYQIIYEQVKKVMPTDAFFVTRYLHANDSLMMDYLIDEGVRYSPFEYENFPANMKKLLFEEKLGYKFATAQEYACFSDE